MTLYHLGLFVHVVAVLALFMALALELTGMWRMRAARTVEQVREWSNVSRPLEVVFPISSVAILLSGIYMVTDAWGWSMAWADVSLVMLLALSVLGGAINGRRLKAIHLAADRIGSGSVPASLAQQINDPVLWTSVQTMAAIALGIVFLMTVKPEWGGSLLTMVIFIALGIAWTRAMGYGRLPTVAGRPRTNT